MNPWEPPKTKVHFWEDEDQLNQATVYTLVGFVAAFTLFAAVGELLRLLLS